MKKELSFLNMSFGLSVQVAYGRMDGKNIKMIEYDKRRSKKYYKIFTRVFMDWAKDHEEKIIKQKSNEKRKR
nr:MAG TPA: hypothetical protein [Caudoviricetes sp.]